MSTQHKKRRLRRRLIAAGVLVTALMAVSVPVADAHPTGVYQVNVPATSSHAPAFHPNPRDRPGFYQAHADVPVVPIVRGTTGTADTGFAWADAGIGAGLAAVAAGLIGAILATRARRSPLTRDPSTGGAA